METHAIFLQLHTAIAAKYKTATHLQYTLSELSFWTGRHYSKDIKV